MNLEAVERLVFFTEIGVSALVLWFNFVKTCGCREILGKEKQFDSLENGFFVFGYLVESENI